MWVHLSAHSATLSARRIVNKPVYLGLSILEISRIIVYEVWYGYVKPKY